MKEVKKSSKFKTGVDALTVFPYEEYHMLIMTWFSQWYGYDSVRMKDIAESYFGYETASKLYDSTLGVPFIAFLKMHVHSQMQKYYEYNDGLIHVPIRKRAGHASAKMFTPENEHVTVTIIDGDTHINGNKSTILDGIPDENGNLDVESFEYIDIIKQIPEIIEIVRKKRRQSTCKDLVYDKFLDIVDTSERQGDISAMAEATGVDRQLISFNVQVIKKEIISELKNRGILNPFSGEE